MSSPLRVNGRFRLLWTARTVSSLGDSLGLVALLLHVATTTGHASSVALLLLAGDGVPALVGPVAGAVSDRFHLTRVVVVCGAVQAALTAVIAVWLPSLGPLLVLVAVRGLANQVFGPASRSLLPLVVADRDLDGANAALGFGANGGEAVGPMLAAALLPLVGVRGVLFADAVTFLIAAVLLAIPRLAARPQDTAPRSGFWRDTGDGLRYLAATPLIRAVGLGFVAIVAANGVDDVALVFLATDTLHAGGSAVAILLAGAGVGLFLGYALLTRSPRLGMPALLVVGFGVSSAGNLLTGLAWAVAAAFAVQAVRGLGVAAMDVAVTTLVQRTVPAALLGRVFGSLYSAVGLAAALSYVLGGLLIDATGPRTTFLLAGGAGLVVTAVVAAALRRA
ncbi:MAG: MFS transporter [Umezawaea sp.]